MRRLLVLVGLMSLLVPAGAGAKPAGSHMTFTVRFIQEATVQHPLPGGGRSFSVTLRLFASGANPFNAPVNYALGAMNFAYTLNGACSSGGGGCKGTSDIKTVTRLPGGTLTADGSKVPLSHTPYTVPISKGTGRFAGATGTILISVGGKAVTNFDITLP